MNRLRFIIHILFVSLLIASCSSGDDDSESSTESLQLFSDKNNIYTGESVNFLVLDGSGNDVTSFANLFINELEISNPYIFMQQGDFEVFATFNSLTSSSITINVSNGNYFPSNELNIWVYDVDNTSSTNPEQNFTDEPDFLEIETSNGNVFTVEVNNGGVPYGLMNGLMSNGTLTRGASTLSFSGNIQLPAEFEDLSNETIALQNFVLYDLYASNNSEMDEVTDTIIEDLDLNGTIVPVTVEYIVKSEKINTMNSMSVNGQTYSNIIHTRLTLNMNIFASIDILGGNNPLDYDIIDDQNILVIDNYFAQGIGLIKSEAVQAYQIEQQFLDILALIPNNTLDIPESLNIVNVQDLDDYLVGD